MSIAESFHGSGGRKRASARVFLTPIKNGTGKITVNKKEVSDYFNEIAAVDAVVRPLHIAGAQGVLGQYDIQVTVKGGGKTGQRDAVCLGLAKALIHLESKKAPVLDAAESQTEEGSVPNLSWRVQLRKAGVLTRDSRKVERKKYGQHKARKRAPLVKR